jgi:outer membrane protein OmpA-like peptidoglycan-associated protein
MRKGEVVIATIPTDKLFAPNDTVLMSSADALLKSFLPYFKVMDKFKVVLALHTDDTGSDSYLTNLAAQRIVALYDYFDTHAKNTDSLTGYPIAANDPLKENNSRENRAENRRLEIYIVPSTVLIEEAKPAK